ncbi:MAG: molybdate ABC transporter permease subunit [Sphingomonadaceae bacterium]
MDTEAFRLSLKLAALTALLLLPVGLFVGRLLAFRRFPGRSLAEALVALPLVLPPTVLGFYLLTALGDTSAVGGLWSAIFGRPLAFSFEGLLVACMIANLPFAVQPMQRAFEAVPQAVREAAWVSGLSPLAAFRKVELPLALPGILSALVLVFAHTIGEFGVVLMVGGAIPGETKTASIAIYDRVQAFDTQAAGFMSAVLLLLSFAAIGLVHALGRRVVLRA